MNISAAALKASSAVTAYSGSSEPIIRFDHSKTRWRSSWGTPIISAITWSGSSAATAVTKSHSPRSITSSTIVRATSRMRSSSWVTMRGVKPLFTSSRMRVCRGGSWISIIIRCCSSASSSRALTVMPPRSDEKVSQSRLTAWMSSWRVTDQNPRMSP